LGSELLVPSPERTGAEFAGLAGSPAFWLSLSATFARGSYGFLISFAAGCSLGFLAGKKRTILDFIKPWLVMIQTIPVLALILIALLWFRTESVPVFVAFLMAFPVVCLNTIEGVKAVDGKLLEMARVFRVSAPRRFSGIYFPSLFPYLLSAAAAAFGLCWKVVIAAEVLSLPRFGVGAGMYEAKVALEMPRVFAWTIAAVLLGFVTDGLLGAAAAWLRRRNAV